MPNPIDPMNWLATLFEWFSNSWTQSGGQALQNAITILTTVQFPNLAEEWFARLWNSAFGLSLLIGLAAIIVHSTVFIFKSKYTTLGAALVQFVRLVFNGGFLLLVVVAAMGVADFLIVLMMSWLSSFLDTATWTEPFSMVLEMNGVNIWLKLAISNAGMLVGNLLFLSTLIMNYWVYIFVIWYLLGSALGVGKVAQLVRSLIFASLLTVLFARVFQVFHLGLSAIVLSVAQTLGLTSIQILLGVLASGMVALCIPVFMVIAFAISSFKVEHRLDVRAFIANQGKNVTNANSSQLAQERVERLRAIGDGTKEATGGAMRWAAMAAATATFAKIGAGIAAKASTATPTPHAKVVGVGLVGIQAGANWLEHKTKSYINNRVGRPGESRARMRQQSA